MDISNKIIIATLLFTCINSAYSQDTDGEQGKNINDQYFLKLTLIKMEKLI